MTNCSLRVRLECPDCGYVHTERPWRYTGQQSGSDELLPMPSALPRLNRDSAC
jgi:hypothetical protein